MKQGNLPYVKLTVTSHQIGSAEYSRLKMLLDTENEWLREEQSTVTQGQPSDASP